MLLRPDLDPTRFRRLLSSADASERAAESPAARRTLSAVPSPHCPAARRRSPSRAEQSHRQEETTLL